MALTHILADHDLRPYCYEITANVFFAVMKGFRALSMLLVGWYLMVPPESTRAAPEANAPLCNWTSTHVYGSASQCEKAIADLKIQKRTAMSNGVGLWNSGNEEHARCVATDDPRLQCGK